MGWRDVLLDGMMFLTTAVVLAVGVAVTYFVIWHVIKWMNEDEKKDL